MLEVTGGGRARDFRRARDHAIIRMFTEGVRRTELVQIRMADLPLDLIATPYVRVVPLKGARAEDSGRIVPLTPATAQAILAYVRARRGHPKAETSPALWLGTRGAMTDSGVYWMIKAVPRRRATTRRRIRTCSGTRSPATGPWAVVRKAI
jgi:site-specific recombinase XerD